MVEKIKKTYKLDSPKVLSVMLQIPREKFVSRIYRNIAYDDSPVPIGFGQTMSQPFTVAFMTHLLLSNKKGVVGKVGKWKVLEIGTGSGYQAAVLSHIVRKVYSVEIVEKLAKKTKDKLKKLGYTNVFVKSGSGGFGWEEKAPFDAILITAGVEGRVPDMLFDQLREGGLLVAPVGRGYDKVMTKFTKKMKKGKEQIIKEKHGIFHFVPFVHEKN
jgi:protein-L-isoaspartate(D-aspartate) O-methyltransferase